jgi:hypothetical protein
MAYTAPGTAVAGEVLTAAFWNAQVRDNITELAGAPMARNILYNGAMQVAQRNTSVTSITAANYYTSDRWNFNVATAGTWTMSVENDAPTGSGLRKSTKLLVTTATGSPTFCNFKQTLEGQDLQRIAKGTSSAQQLTLSFWVKSNVTGTYICELYDADNTRQVSASYTISASGTWEKKTITFPADTTGAFDNDNAGSLDVSFGLAFGSTWTSGTLNTAWASVTSANRYAGQTNLAANTNNYWQVTGVQLETGSVATGFEFLPFGDELSRCQRYHIRFVDTSTNVGEIGAGFLYNTTNATISIPLQIEMRIPPAVSSASLSNLYLVDSGIASAQVSAIVDSGQSTRRVASINVAVSSALTATRYATLRQNGTAGMVAVSAEL